MKPADKAKIEEAQKKQDAAFEAYNRNDLAEGNRLLNESTQILEALVC